MLSEHPEVALPEAGKELHYFDREVLSHGLDWYIACFSGPGGAGCRGEITPEYARLPPRFGKPPCDTPGVRGSCSC